MKKAVPMILSEDNFKQIFAFADRNSRLAKLLYNAALFRIRQVFTGWKRLSVEVTEYDGESDPSFLSQRYGGP